MRLNKLLVVLTLASYVHLPAAHADDTLDFKDFDEASAPAESGPAPAAQNADPQFQAELADTIRDLDQIEEQPALLPPTVPKAQAVRKLARVDVRVDVQRIEKGGKGKGGGKGKHRAGGGGKGKGGGKGGGGKSKPPRSGGGGKKH
jgi:hypothetical protein